MAVARACTRLVCPDMPREFKAIMKLMFSEVVPVPRLCSESMTAVDHAFGRKMRTTLETESR